LFLTFTIISNDLDTAANQDILFEFTSLKKGPKADQPIFYVAKIKNFECCHSKKCGKIKLGYLMAESDILPSYHEVRIKQTCPNAEFFWIVMKGIKDAKQAKEAAKLWEKNIFKDLNDYRIHEEKELFHINLPTEIIFKSASHHGKKLLSEYSGKELIFYSNSGKKV
jgi:hypothetical protein